MPRFDTMRFAHCLLIITQQMHDLFCYDERKNGIMDIILSVDDIQVDKQYCYFGDVCCFPVCCWERRVSIWAFGEIHVDVL